MKNKKRHTWRKGGYPQICKACGMFRERKTFKILMAISGTPPYDHYKYESKMIYIHYPHGVEIEHHKAPVCQPY